MTIRPGGPEDQSFCPNRLRAVAACGSNFSLFLVDPYTNSDKQERKLSFNNKLVCKVGWLKVIDSYLSDIMRGKQRTAPGVESNRENWQRNRARFLDRIRVPSSTPPTRGGRLSMF